MTEADVAALGIALALVARDSAATFNIVLCNPTDGRVRSAYRTDTVRTQSEVAAAMRDLYEHAVKLGQEQGFLGKVSPYSDPVIAEVSEKFMAMSSADMNPCLEMIEGLGKASGGSGDVILVAVGTRRFLGAWNGYSLLVRSR